MLFIGTIFVSLLTLFGVLLNIGWIGITIYVGFDEFLLFISKFGFYYVLFLFYKLESFWYATGG